MGVVHMAIQKIDKPLAVTIEQAGRLLGISRNLAYERLKVAKFQRLS